MILSLVLYVLSFFKVFDGQYLDLFIISVAIIYTSLYFGNHVSKLNSDAKEDDTVGHLESKRFLPTDKLDTEGSMSSDSLDQETFSFSTDSLDASDDSYMSADSLELNDTDFSDYPDSRGSYSLLTSSTRSEGHQHLLSSSLFSSKSSRSRRGSSLKSNGDGSFSNSEY